MASTRLQGRCLLCQHSIRRPQTFNSNLSLLTFPSLRNQSRLRQRRNPDERPTRMQLSPTVAKSRRDPVKEDYRKAQQANPFGYMNQTATKIVRREKTDEPRQPRPSTSTQRSGTTRTYGKGRNREDKPKQTNEDTFHALKMQRALTEIPYKQRMATKNKIAEIDSFDDFPLLDSIKSSIGPQALAGIEEVIPSPIQRLAIPEIMGRKPTRTRKQKDAPIDLEKGPMKQVLIAAETGSGKTLAYLLPVMDAVKRQEAIDERLAAQAREEAEKRKKEDPSFVEPPPLDDRVNPSMGRPRAIILVPTTELVNQVTSVLKSFSHTVKFRCAGIASNLTPKVIHNRLFQASGIDIVVSTPSLLASICTTEPNLLSRVTHLVVDEADSLFDRSFNPLTNEIVAKSMSSLRQLILCSATIPRSLDTYLTNRFPDLVRLTTPQLHAISRRVQLGVVDVEREPYHGNKLLACADSIWTIGKQGETPSEDKDALSDPASFGLKRIMVFVNEREKTQEVTTYLVNKGIDAMALTRDTALERESPVLGAFTIAPTKPVALSDVATPRSVPFTTANTSAAQSTKRTLPGVKVLVTTDLGSRGLDTLAVRHVILYDVPHSTIDFIHRLGRTGRFNRRGRGIVLVGKNDRRDVVREVREGMFRGQALI